MASQRIGSAPLAAQLAGRRRAEAYAATLGASLAARMTAPRAAVAGAEGFVGAALTRALSRAGVPVSSLTRRVPPASIEPPATMFWLVSSVNPGIAERRPDLVAADRAAFARMLDHQRSAPRPPVVVLTSSGGSLYDPAAAPPHAENAPLRPISVYGRIKRALEEDLLAADWVIPVILRISNVYGPGQRIVPGFGVVAHGIRAALDGRPLRLYGDPRRDYLFIDDLVTAMTRIHEEVAMAHRTGRRPDLPAVLNIATGRPTSLSRLVEVLRRTTGRPLPAERCEARPFDQPDVWLDAGLAGRALGWRPRTPLEWGVRKTWLAARGAAA
ncbi:NAD-dependent epimerase/dehydratase family protein [Nonomuraea sp. NPDC049158]|uniref:NAD-dependent epimerase/dehydratase family protein n=1 Tax=Nonomuraea sp. NPDC049158 TaxID=3155649 RepID=UPI0033EB6F61